jgi:CheY-like chemotaxis protein
MLNLRFLIVDRSKALQAFLIQLFENFSFETRLIKACDTPAAALAQARELKPDFLLTDWFAGDALDGLALYREILQFAPACQFALLSSNVTAEKKEQAAAAGAIFLLHKPCTAVQLRTALGLALKEIARRNPRVDDHVEVDAIAAARHLEALKFAASQPVFKAGDRVIFRGQPDTVKNVILRRGAATLQLSQGNLLVSPEQVKRA